MDYDELCAVTQQRLQPEYTEELNMTMDVMDKHMDPNGIDQHTSGAKMDANKIDMSLLELLSDALIEVCRVMDYGQTKYTRGGFADVPEAVTRYSAAMLRHYFAEQKQKYDYGDPFYGTEAGLPFKGKIRHDAQVAVNALFRLQCQLNDEASFSGTNTSLKET
ncbi:MAG: hypothetical protein GY820_21095 [Gammaproteobacteria bacterium]|nr:hypothetical protein [Gammaproteobacteria bacterium]